MIYKHLLKPFLFAQNAEKAHDWALKTASSTHQSSTLQFLANAVYGGSDKGLAQNLMGLTFPNPIGLAAGFDKNGRTINAMAALGFGFVEVGSITAVPSKGNPKPRVFRLPEDRSLINRMGLNNDGAEVIINRLKNSQSKIPLGINIAKTNDMTIHGDAAILDYQTSYNLAKTVADYITVNISCPNTGEGKTFEDPAALKDLLQALTLKNEPVPTLVKFSVDTNKETLWELIALCEDLGVDGYVATNTSSTRTGLQTPVDALQSIGNGGLSGAAIANKSTEVVSWIYDALKGKKPIIGVGGIDSPAQALAKLDAGANLIQLYSGLVYEGPALLKRIKKELRGFV
ncbi:MAG: quinone-dependent dihydroorotate dehydrogenase [Balneolaceae bacterium]